MIKKVDIYEFVDLARVPDVVVLDARSPKEFQMGHIPGSQNLPLLNDDERHVVGITYKNQGHNEAVKKGFELVGHKFIDYIRQAEELSPSKKVMVYCWRGGLRSNILSWLLNMSGFEIELLEGGYKSYRNFCLNAFARERNMLILAGKTGSGKSDLLHDLEEQGEFILDLEGLAHHKGSAFGGINQKEQPTQEQFENLIAWKLSEKADAITWVENESRFVGRVRVPDAFFERMSTANILEINRNTEARIQRILNEYGSFSKEILAERTTSISKRMGGDRVKESLTCLEQDDMIGWVGPLLDYYDRTYSHSFSQRKGKLLAQLEIDAMQESEIVSLLIETKNKLYR